MRERAWFYHMISPTDKLAGKSIDQVQRRMCMYVYMFRETNLKPQLRYCKQRGEQ